MIHDRRWTAALAEHERALAAFASACERIPPASWHRAPAPGKWSPAEVVVHVCQAYELGRDAAAGGPGMRLLVSRRRAWQLRTLMLPLVVVTSRFPRGVPAPREVTPDPAASRGLTPDAAAARLERVAGDAAAALRRAADVRPMPRIMHAYFGALTPRASLRLLSAHTRHHARGLARLHPAAAG